MSEPICQPALLDRSELQGILFARNPEPMLVYECDTLRFCAVNQAAVARYGYTEAEFLTLTLADIRPAEDAEILQQTLAELPEGSRSSGIWRHRSKLGELFWVNIFSQSVIFEGQPARLVTARDVTHRRREDEENRLLTAAMRDVVSLLDMAGRYLYVSPSIQQATGYSVEEVLGTCVYDMFHPNDLERTQREEGRTRMPDGSCLTEWRRRCKDGSYRWFETRTTHLPAENDQPARMLCESRDIEQRKAAEDALRRTQDQYRSIFENAIEGIFQSTRDGQYLSVNPALARIYGYQSPEDLIAHLDDIAHGLYLDPRRRDEFVLRMHADGIVVNFESQVRRKDGSPIWISESAHSVCDARGALLYYEGMVEDITERKALEVERERMLAEALARADRDPLTNLFNHRSFHKRLEECQVPYTVALLDLDNFGFFNDAYGHAVGDDLLRRVAVHLENFCDPGTIAARYGGDEFALLIPGLPSDSAAEFIHHCLAQISHLGYRPPQHNSTIPLSFSIGMAAFPEDGPTRTDVLHTADKRLLRAKTGGDGDAPAAHLREALTETLQGFSMLDALVTAVDNKDRYTRRHSEDVMTHCLAIAREIKLDAETQDTLAIASLLHDVGKIGVPDHILRKPGRLTDEEFAAVKHHPLMGAVIVGAVFGFEKTLDAVRHHHERWDGGGYPYGLQGEQIPLLARMMAVADAYSAMTTDRPYRKGMHPDNALAILEEGMGSQWDPYCVHAFLQIHRPHVLAVPVQIGQAA